MTTEAELRIQDVSKSFGGVQAIGQVSLEVRRGRNCLDYWTQRGWEDDTAEYGQWLLPPGRRRDFLDDRDITHLAPSRIAALGIARTFQNIALFRGMTVLDNLMLGRHIHMRTGVLTAMLRFGPALREEVAHRQFVEDVIEFLEIEALRKRPVGSLPYGLQKRVELGRALAAQPRILLLDEPMGGMNVEEKEDMARFILDVNEEWAPPSCSLSTTWGS